MATGLTDSYKNVQNMAWNYFHLLAQQRVTHFNLFIVFVGAISAIFATQINESLRGNIIALALALIEIFLCFIFYKIDMRNRFLIKHTEKVLIQIEAILEQGVPKLFTEEATSTGDIRKSESKKIWAFRQLSTSQLYKSFYLFFFVAGLIGFALSSILIIVNYI
jgi:hypothetical protein